MPSLVLGSLLTPGPSAHALLCPPSQERQRLETILNLCAEYSRADGGPEAGELPSIGEAAAALALAGRRPSRGLAAGTGAPGRGSEEPGGAAQRLWESVERSDEENLKEECSSTESTQQEVGPSGGWSAGSMAGGWGPRRQHAVGTKTLRAGSSGSQGHPGLRGVEMRRQGRGAGADESPKP